MKKKPLVEFDKDHRKMNYEWLAWIVIMLAIVLLTIVWWVWLKRALA